MCSRCRPWPPGRFRLPQRCSMMRLLRSEKPGLCRVPGGPAVPGPASAAASLPQPRSRHWRLHRPRRARLPGRYQAHQRPPGAVPGRHQAHQRPPGAVPGRHQAHQGNRTYRTPPRPWRPPHHSSTAMWHRCRPGHRNVTLRCLRPAARRTTGTTGTTRPASRCSLHNSHIDAVKDSTPDGEDGHQRQRCTGGTACPALRTRRFTV
jgi:hypothetical protein